MTEWRYAPASDAGIAIADAAGHATRQLCIAPVDLLNGRRRPGKSDIFVVVDLPRCSSPVVPNTVHLSFDDALRVPVELRSAQGDILARDKLPIDSLFGYMRPDRALRNLIGKWVVSARSPVDSYVPAFLWRGDVSEGEFTRVADMHLYSQVRFSPRDALFIRTSEQAYSAVRGSGDGAENWRNGNAGWWIAEAIDLHARNPLFLNNHQKYYRKCLRGKEVELKFSFLEPVDIWALTVETLESIEQGRLPGFIPEYRDEFQQWDYPTRLFEVLEPENKRGYVSVIPTTDGRHIIKQKCFAQDALVRDEAISEPVDIEGAIQPFLAARFGSVLRPLPPLRRVRYDVDLESVATGHVYGIFFDCVSVVGAEHLALHQCEIEYLRTRCVVEPRESLIFDELQTIVDWVRNDLGARDLRADEGYYSKLSFLRDLVSTGRLRDDPAPELLS